MRGLSRNKLFAITVLLGLLFGVSAGVIAAEKHSRQNTQEARKRALHALNRLTFGPRPGDVDRVLSIGVDKWIDQQLNPEKIDDSAVNGRLAAFRTLNMDPREMIANFPPPQVLKQVADGKRAMPNDPEKRAIYEAAIEKYQARKEKKADPADQAQMSPEEMTPEQRQERRAARIRSRQAADGLMGMDQDARMAAILKISPEERTELVKGLSPQERLALTDGMSPRQKETLLALANPQAVIPLELMQAKLIRAVYSERQLEEVMTDFWFNHFNVFIGKGPDRYLITAYERDVIRPHAMGKFKDLLMATAKSPAMLFYLDNWQSLGPDSQAALTRTKLSEGDLAGLPPMARRRINRQRIDRLERLAKNAPKGLNENYAREIMELHTLGVNGGYTQKDVTELAKILTGWTIKQPRQGGGFEYNDRMHEPGTKYFLGQKFKEDGEREGERAIEMLARSPSTAKFISRKLAMRFVSDNPPDSLVNRMAETFTKSDGDIRQVLRTMFHSPEFWAPEAYRAKIKTPLEFIASSLRATNADVQTGIALVQQLNKMGMPLYGCQPPTGYSMKSDAWVNSSALLDRMNFALALGTGRIPGVAVSPQQLPAGDSADARVVQASLEQSLLGGDVSAKTHETLAKQLDDPQITGRRLDDAARPVNAGVLAGLILGSPEFQRR